MTKEELIKKWLNYDLSIEEQSAFEQLDDYEQLLKLNASLQAFKSHEFDEESSFNSLNSKALIAQVKRRSWIRPLLRVAAILAIGLCVLYYVHTLDTTIQTDIAQKTAVSLPDHSIVELNANSTLSYNKKDWKTSRQIALSGEAFFKVAKGKTFDVITSDGIVSVLGTQFNVKQRNAYFEVMCYKGVVSVNYAGDSTKLPPGKTFRVIDGKMLAYEKENTVQPAWLHGETSFDNVPLTHVVAEIENQYKLKISFEGIDGSRLFSGSVTHKNLDLALQSVTIPLHLSYSKSGNSIILKRE